MKIAKGLIAIIILGGLTLSGCKKDKDDPEPTPTDIQFSIRMNHHANGSVVQWDSIMYTNAFGNPFSVVTLKYFISDFVLHNANGTTVEFDEIHYVDAFDGTGVTYVPSKRVPNGTYTHVSFTYGIDAAKNVDGIFVNPPESNMEWPLGLGGGYHYMKLEGKHDDMGTIKNYQCHTGPTQSVDYSVDVTIPGSAFTATGSNLMFDLVFNIEKWWENPNTLDLNNMTMVMGNPSMQTMLSANDKMYSRLEV